MRLPEIPTAVARRLPLVGTAVLSAWYLAFFVMMAGKGPYDPDAWFLLATGRRIAESGIPMENPFSVVPGLQIVVQQWLHDVLLYSAYAVGGFTAMHAFQFLLLALTATALFASLRFLSSGRMPLHVAIAVSIAALALFRGYFSVRPLPWSACAFLAVICALVRARRSGNPIWYLVLPAVVLIHVQLQASMMPLDILTAAAFLLPDRVAELKGRDSRRLYFADRRILLLMICLACAVSLLNPYGLKGATYLFRSLGEASYGNYIAEMQPPFRSLGVPFAILYTAPMLVVAILCHLANRRLPTLPVAVLVIGGIFAGATAYRNLWVYGLALAVSCALAYSTRVPVPASSEETAPSNSGDLIAVSAVPRPLMVAAPVLFAVLVLLAGHGAIAVGVVENGAIPQSSGRVDSWAFYETYARPLTDELKKLPAGSRVLVDDGVTANYMEWAGVPVVFDYRPEIWGPKISGVEGYRPYRDFVRAIHGEDSWTDYVTEGDWDAMLVLAKGADAYGALDGWRIDDRNAGFALILPE